MKKPFWILGITFPIFTILVVLYYIHTETMVGSLHNLITIAVSFGITQLILGLFLGHRITVYTKFQSAVLFVLLSIISIGIDGVIYTILYEYIPNNFQGFSFEILIIAAMFSIAVLIIPVILLNGLVLAIYIFLFHKTI